MSNANTNTVQIKQSTNLNVTDAGQTWPTINVQSSTIVVENTLQFRAQLVATLQTNQLYLPTILTLWAAADPAQAVPTLNFLVLYSDADVDVELGADTTPQGVVSAGAPATPAKLWTVHATAATPLMLFGPLVLPGGLPTPSTTPPTPYYITRVRVQESLGNQANVHLMVG